MYGIFICAVHWFIYSLYFAIKTCSCCNLKTYIWLTRLSLIKICCFDLVRLLEVIEIGDDFSCTSTKSIDIMQISSDYNWQNNTVYKWNHADNSNFENKIAVHICIDKEYLDKTIVRSFLYTI